MALRNEQFSTENNNSKELKFENLEENNLKINKQNKKYYTRSCIESDLQRNFVINGNNERKKFLDSSCFDPSQSRVELENRTDIVDSYFLKKNDNGKKNTLETIFTNTRGDEKSKMRIFNSTSKKKLKRNKSFKDFFGSMIKWKKSERKERPRCFMSCDHLLEELESFSFKNNKKLTKASSFPTVVIQDFEKNSTQNLDRKATIRPIYGGKRNEQHLETFAKKQENRKFFVMDESVEDLVKPSNIKNIVKHLSQFSQKSGINHHFNEKNEQFIQKHY
ncbi:PREDICTED: uncharacterized protein LOC108571498 [Habropoda laboriosa]|uniref:uncharacterized protein LOC108571498 n=1 Tax=Habropoda laboriosa TaxID=597456 RepID=UPI00083D16F8|nr:PREDICTED: uncharacterized protein LOC108571498 [Habropoda laboriosa]